MGPDIAKESHRKKIEGLHFQGLGARHPIIVRSLTDSDIRYDFDLYVGLKCSYYFGGNYKPQSGTEVLICFDVYLPQEYMQK